MQVIVITHAYGNRKGVRYLTSGVKVYYIPCIPIYNQTTLPAFFTSFPYFRNITLREKIDIVHCHAVSTLPYLCCQSHSGEGVLRTRAESLNISLSDGISDLFHRPLSVRLC